MSGSEPIEDIYDAFAATYDASRDQFDLSEVLREFSAGLGDRPEQGRLLDLGCGAGEPVARDFASRGWQVTGVDVSRAMLVLAARYVPQLTLIHADMREVDFPESSFDAITAVYSLFHVPREEHPALFAKMRRWLVPGGRVLMTYATREYTGHDRFDGEKEFMGRSLFYSHATPDELREQLAGAGFRIVDARKRQIGGETFLWVTVERPSDSSVAGMGFTQSASTRASSGVPES